jgi:hypothetical protein
MPDMTYEFLIETVARKMCLFYGGNPDECYHGGTKPYWKLYANRAKDILDVILPYLDSLPDQEREELRVSAREQLARWEIK